jgi:hypothetical protein
MEKSEFLSYVEKDNEVTIYPYTYIEYEDYFGNTYNLLIVDRLQFPADTVAGKVVIDPVVAFGREKLRWDIPIE